MRAIGTKRALSQSSQQVPLALQSRDQGLTPKKSEEEMRLSENFGAESFKIHTNGQDIRFRGIYYGPNGEIFSSEAAEISYEEKIEREEHPVVLFNLQKFIKDTLAIFAPTIPIERKQGHITHTSQSEQAAIPAKAANNQMAFAENAQSIFYSKASNNGAMPTLMASGPSFQDVATHDYITAPLFGGISSKAKFLCAADPIMGSINPTSPLFAKTSPLLTIDKVGPSFAEQLDYDPPTPSFYLSPYAAPAPRFH